MTRGTWPSGRLLAWYFVSLLWFGVLAALAMLTVFRMVRTSGLSQLIAFDDVPLLRLFELDYGRIYWAAAAGSLLLLVAVALLAPLRIATLRDFLRRPPRERVGVWLVLAMLALLALVLIDGRYSHDPETQKLLVHSPKVTGWFIAPLAVACGWLLARAIILAAPRQRPLAADERPSRALTSLAAIFLLALAALTADVFWSHYKFWDHELNGNHDYVRFFAEDERREADLVLLATSTAFAALAALAGCGGYLLFRKAAPPLPGGVPSRGQCLRLAALVTAAWTFALGVPWQVKLLPEIEAENGWSMPAMVLAFLAAGIAPLVAATLAALRSDFAKSTTLTIRPSEHALWSAVLFPFYPLVHWLPLRPRWRYGLLMLLSGLMIVGLMVLITEVDEWFDFDDWRDMLRGAQFPFLKASFALLTAQFAYLALRRTGRPLARFPWLSRPWVTAACQASLIATAAAALAFASWPFWGWSNVRKNVFARCVEFNDRHKFELRFLHWLFDADRDGYAAVLHGADWNDWDRSIQAGGIDPPQVVRLTPDRFEVVDRRRADALPNLVIFYLEGVTPTSIGAYGKRNLPPDLSPTPNMDRVAAEGTLFTQARCFYPSTWDAWYATSTGRFLRVQEFHASELLGDRYSPYNDLYKVLDAAGIDRWCHANCEPYPQLLAPPHLHDGRKPAWEPDCNSALTRDEEEAGVWRGDKRVDRICRFLDSIRPGERFFLCEHMADTHFPWKRTPLAHAQELGFPQGFEPYEEDAKLPGLGRSDVYCRYFHTITRMDAQIGRVLEKLRQRKLYDRTMVVIVSDHGCQWWEHERMYYVSHIYDPAIHVPLIVRLPGAEGGGVCDEPVLQIDVVPTLAELAGARHVNADETGALPGRSLLPALVHRGRVPSQVAEGYRHRDVPLLTHYNLLGLIHDFRYKLIFNRPLGTYLLFDLENDPGEMTNIADREPEILADMLQRIRKAFNDNPVLLGEIER